MTCTHTVLIVEDFPPDRELYRRSLLADASHVYLLLEAESTQAGLELCRTQTIDLILLDYRLPDGDGLSFLAELRSQQLGEMPPVIVVTGQGDESIAVQAMKLGAEDYLVKYQLTPERLQVTIGMALENARLRWELRRSQAELQESIEREQIVHQITQQIRRSLNPTEVLNTAVTEVRQFLAVDRAFIYRFYPDFSGRIVVESFGAGLSAAIGSEVEDTYFMETRGEDYRQGRIQVVEDVSTAGLTECHRDMLARFVIRANLVVPILQGPLLWGLVVVSQCQPRRWRSLEVNLTQQLAAQIGIAIQQAELYQQLQIELLDRQQLEVALQQSQQRLQLAIDGAGMATWDFDLQNQRAICSEGHFRIMGYEPDPTGEMSLEMCQSRVHPDDLERLFVAIDHARITRSMYSPDHRIIRADTGEVRWIQVFGRFLYNEAGAAIRSMGVFFDITERKQMELELTQSNDRFELAAAAVNSIIYDWDLQTDRVERTRGLYEVTGYLPEEAEPTAEWWFNLMHPDDRPKKTRERVLTELAHLDRYCNEYRVRHREGHYIWVEDWAQVLKDEAGQPIRIVGNSRDISDRKRAEQQVRESEERLLLGVQVAGVALARFDYATNLVQLSLEAADMYGLPTDQLTVTRAQVHATFHPDERDLMEQIIAGVLDPAGDGWFAREHRVVWQTGEVRWLSVRKQVFFDRSGPVHRPDYAILAAIDVTDRKRVEIERAALLAEAEAARAEAEAANRSKDEFVAIVAHELRSPLNSILGWAQLLRTRQFDTATINRALETIERNTLAQVQLVEDLLDISRMVRGTLHLNLATGNLGNVIEAALDLVRPQAQAKSLTITFTAGDAACLVSGDFNRLQQIIVNLVTNAIKFTPDRGQIEIQLEQVAIEGFTAEINPHPRYSTLSAYAQIRVIDTGKGIAPEFLPRIFDRFQQGQRNTGSKDGLGLGLAIVKNLVELHQGMITVESPGLGQGATFTVQLPSLNAPVERLVREVEAIAPGFSSLAGVRILVVDDDPDMLELLRLLLEESQAEVRSTNTIAAALALLPDFQPQLLISDIAMPEGSGYDLVQQMRSLPFGQIPAIAMTAYASTSHVEQSLQAGFQEHLTKPVNAEALLAAIHRLLSDANLSSKNQGGC